MTTIQQNSAGDFLPVNRVAEGDGAVATPVPSPVNSTASSASKANTQARAETAGTGVGGITAPVPVEGVDRDAAAQYLKTVRDNRWSIEGVLTGGCDNTTIVQAFARHRIAEQERCAGIADHQYNEMYRIAQVHRSDGNEAAWSRTDARARTASIIAAEIRRPS